MQHGFAISISQRHSWNSAPGHLDLVHDMHVPTKYSVQSVELIADLAAHIGGFATQKLNHLASIVEGGGTYRNGLQ